MPVNSYSFCPQTENSPDPQTEYNQLVKQMQFGEPLPAVANTSKYQKIREEMQIHARGIHPERILFRRHLTEDEGCHQWRLKNFCPITQPAYKRGLAALSRIMQGAHFSVNISNDLRQYLSKRKFYGNDFFRFFQQQILTQMVEDPNAFLVWLPKALHSSPPYGFNTRTKIEVESYLIPSSKIIYQSANYLVLSVPESSTVWVGNQARKNGEVRYILSAEGVSRLEQKGHLHEKKFELLYYYPHELGYIPAFQLGGIPHPEGYYESFFSGFLAFANEALRQFSDWQVVTASNAYPFKEIRLPQCKQRSCSNGYIGNDVCPSCLGSGYELKTGPFAAIVRPASPTGLSDATDEQPMLRFITPPTSIMQYAQQAWEILLQKAEESLHLRFIQEAQSGIAKALDREEFYAHLAAISDNLFDRLMLPSLETIEKYRNIFRPQPVRIQKPTTFTIPQAESLQNELMQQNTHGSNPFLSNFALQQFINQKYGADPMIQAQTKFMLQFDPLLFDTPERINQKIEKGIVSLQQVQLHQFLPVILQQLSARITANDWETLDYPTLSQHVYNLFAQIQEQNNSVHSTPLQ